jgi:hypothetical protein
MEFAGLPSGFKREAGAKPVLALHHSVTTPSVKKRLMGLLTLVGRCAVPGRQAGDAGRTQFCQNWTRTPVRGLPPASS